MIRDTLPNTPKKKRSALENFTGMVLGFVFTNFVSTWFERANPNSDHNRLKTEEEKMNRLEQMQIEFQRNFNHTKTIEEGIVGAINVLNKKIYNTEIKVSNLENNLAHFMWQSMFVHTKIQHMYLNLMAITHEYANYGRVAVTELSDLLNTTILKDVTNYDTLFNSIEYPLANKLDYTVVRFRFMVRQKSKQAKIYRIISFKHWQNLTGTPVYVRYLGDEFLIYNKSNNCAHGIRNPANYFQSIFDVCLEKNGNDRNIQLWKPSLEDIESNDKIDPQVKRVGNSIYIYCYPGNITIIERNYRCPPYVFKTHKDTEFELKNGIRYTMTRFGYNFTEDQVYESDPFGVHHIPESEYVDELDLLDKITHLKNQIGQIKTNFSDYENMVIVHKSSTSFYALIALFIVCGGIILYLICLLVLRPRIMYAIARQELGKKIFEDLEEVELNTRERRKGRAVELPHPLEGYE